MRRFKHQQSLPVQIRFCAEVNINTRLSNELALATTAVTEEPDVDTRGGAAIRLTMKRQVPDLTEASNRKVTAFLFSSLENRLLKKNLVGACRHRLEKMVFILTQGEPASFHTRGEPRL